jgi:type III pantothenate kinase
MNTLLIDAGNTRIKWALLRDNKLSRQQAIAIDDLRPFTQWLTRTAKIDQVYGVCVAGEKIEATLQAALKRARHPAPRFLHSATNGAGVRNGYRDPQRLGDDRWIAAIAAWHLAGCYRTVCAVSVGTALTIDVVDHDGRHRGGLIAPGPALMVNALLLNTHGIAERMGTSKGRTRRPARKEADLTVRPLANNTEDAIHLGSLTAAAALIDRTVTEVTRELGVRPVVFLTGGGAEALTPLIKGACKPYDDLVLRGLAVMAGAPVRRKA